MSASLKQKTVSGIKWQVVSKVLQKVLSVATFVVLARVLEPSFFGIFSMSFLAIDALGLFKSFGIDAALIRKNQATEQETDTAFMMIVIQGLITAVFCYFLAEPAASFFKEPEIKSVIRALAVFFVLSGIGKVPSALLTKRMQFRLMSIVELSAAVIHCLFAIVFVLLRPDIWSLVMAYLVKTVALTWFAWHVSGYRPRWHFDRKTALEFFHFGKFMVGISLLGYLIQNINNIAVGKMLGAAILGYYVLADNIGNFINTHFTFLISRVIFPAYVAIQDQSDALKRAYLKTLKFVSMLSVPFSVALIALASELTLTLYGEKWLPMVPLVRLFGFLQLVVPIAVCSGPLFIACNKPHYRFRLDLLEISLRIPLVVIGLKIWGVTGAVISGMLVLGALVPLNLRLVRKIVFFQWGELLSQLRPSFFCALLMLAAILLAKGVVYTNGFTGLWQEEVFLLTLFSSCGAAAYLVGFLLVDRKAALEAGQMIFKIQKT